MQRLVDAWCWARKWPPGGFLLVLAGVVLYWPVATKLVQDWTERDDYSHGFLIVPLALYFARERWDQLSSTSRSPSSYGLILVLLSIGVLVAGRLGAELFLTRVSFIGVLAGSIWFVCGSQHLRILLFPLAFLLLMIPLPAIIFNQIAFPLQLIASQFGTSALRVCDVPVLREGNVIVLANTTLEVVEACSGIRFLISLLTLGIVYGYFLDSRLWVRLVIAASTVPIAIVANGLRVAGTGVLAHFYGAEAAEGFLHTFSGWLVFVAAFTLLFVVAQLVKRLAPAPVVPPASRGDAAVPA